MGKTALYAGLFFIVFVTVYRLVESRYTSPVTAAVGTITVATRDLGDIRTLISPSATSTDGAYDSMDSPLGSSYSVPSGRSLLLGALAVTADATSTITVTIGYGDTHVEASTSTPAGAVTLAEYVLPAAAGHERMPLTGAIPAGGHPWVQISGTAWPGRVVITGVER